MSLHEDSDYILEPGDYGLGWDDGAAIVSSLAIYFRDLPHTVVASEVPVGPNLPNRDDARIPGLLVAFECDPELLKERRGYSMESRGSPSA